MRAIRLLLLVTMLAFLPLPGWVDAAIAHASTAIAATDADEGCEQISVSTAAETRAANDDRPAEHQSLSSDVAELGSDVAEMDSDLAELASDVAEMGSDLAELGSDLAEQLLPTAPLRLRSSAGHAGPPSYAGAVLPEPDLPLLPRPPRA